MYVDMLLQQVLITLLFSISSKYNNWTWKCNFLFRSASWQLEEVGKEVKQILPQGTFRKHKRSDSNGSNTTTSSRSTTLHSDKMARSNSQRARSQLFETHLAKLFKQKVEIFTKVEFTQVKTRKQNIRDFLVVMASNTDDGRHLLIVVYLTGISCYDNSEAVSEEFARICTAPNVQQERVSADSARHSVLKSSFERNSWGRSCSWLLARWGDLHQKPSFSFILITTEYICVWSFIHRPCCVCFGITGDRCGFGEVSWCDSIGATNLGQTHTS